MMMIMKLRIKLLLELIGPTEHVSHQSGTISCPGSHVLDLDEPMNYEEAMMSPNSDRWLEAMKFEIESMYENKVWT